MTFTGLVHNYAGLMVCRVLLGVAEAGFFPGAVYIITRWYDQKQLQLRIALFYCASALSGAFSGLLAFAIVKMKGVGGRPGWAWIFLLEGAVTVLIGIATFFFMPDSPELSKWLSPEEKSYLMIQRAIKEGGKKNVEGEAEKFQWKLVWELFSDYKLYLQAFILFTASAAAYGLKFTMPSITKSMGFTSSQAQLMTIPPYVIGAISAISFSKLSDKFQWRMPFVVIPLSIVLLGFAIILPLAPHIKHQIPACYIGVILICMGQYPTNPAGSAWMAGNAANDMKRSMAVAANIALGNAGGILGSYMFLDSEKSKGYPTGFGIGLGLSAAAICSTLFLEYSYWRINKRRDAIPEAEIRAQYTDDQLALMGDQSPLYRHKL